MRSILGALFLLGCSLQAEVVDRVAVVVGKDVITESEILRQIRLTAFQNKEKPDTSPENKRAVAEKLVEQTLIRHEIESNRYVLGDLPDIGRTLAGFKAERFKTDADYRAALKEYEITEDELKEQLKWQLTLVPFIDVRFRPAVQISADDIKDYYEHELLPKWRSLTERPPTLEEATPSIESILTSDRADHALDRWLGQMRTQTRIRFHPEVFR